jgi:lipoprotein NlpI
MLESKYMDVSRHLDTMLCFIKLTLTNNTYNFELYRFTMVSTTTSNFTKYETTLILKVLAH